MFNSARLVGPAVAGVLIGWVGEGPIFVINAVSYLCVLGALAAIRLTGQPPEPAGPVLQNIARGFAYSFRFVPIRDLLTLLMLVSLVGVPYVVLLPVFASDILGGGASTLGLLTSCAGFGAVIGAFSLASRNSVVGLGRLIVRAALLFGVTLVSFAFSEILWLSCVLLVASGFAVMVITASINTMLQTLVDEDMRGRVMSLYTMAFIGMSPVGSLVGGAIAVRVGAPLAVTLGGVGCLALAFWFRRRLAPLREIVYPGVRAHGDSSRGGSGAAHGEHVPAEELAQRPPAFAGGRPCMNHHRAQQAARDEGSDPYGSATAASMFGICTTICCLPSCMKVLSP